MSRSLMTRPIHDLDYLHLHVQWFMISYPETEKYKVINNQA